MEIILATKQDVATKAGEKITTTFTIEFDSQRQAARILNLAGGSISNCLNGKRETVGGWSFEYAESKAN